MKKPEKKQYPKKIYLQIESGSGDLIGPDELTSIYGVTWNTERINKSDLVYYRKPTRRRSE